MIDLVLAQLIHQERIQAAEAAWAERMYETAFAARAPQGASATRHLRVSIAQALHWLAATVEPSTSSWQSTRDDGSWKSRVLDAG